MRLSILVLTLLFSLSAHTDYFNNTFGSPELSQLDVLTDRYDAKEQIKAFKGQLIKIAIIDTGYNPMLATTKLKLCKTGHFDTRTGRDAVGFNGPHGTIVASIIAEELADINYCAVIYQVMGNDGITTNTIKQAFDRAKDSGFAAINLSVSGRVFSFYERRAIRAVADRGTMVFAAAGNDRINLDAFCSAFPACYGIPNMYVVGATIRNNEIPAPYSNYGKIVDIWLPGDFEWGTEVAEGTSFAAPRALADYVYSLHLLQAAR
jgi:subtilisin family serine protease